MANQFGKPWLITKPGIARTLDELMEYLELVGSWTEEGLYGVEDSLSGVDLDGETSERVLHCTRWDEPPAGGGGEAPPAPAHHLPTSTTVMPYILPPAS